MTPRAGGDADPRTLRSQVALTVAIIDLASRQSVSDISITELCRRAGVTRRTFYNHAQSPVQLLRRALTEELDLVRDAMIRDTADQDANLEAAVRRSLGSIIDHVQHHRAIYHDPATRRIHPELYQLLSDHFFAAAHTSITTAVRRIPDPGPDADQRALATDVLASYVAHAYAGVIETALNNPASATTDFVLDLVIGALPGWMLTNPSGQ